jgi:hypothetical protein
VLRPAREQPLAATWVAMRLKSGNARVSFGPGTRIGPEFRDMRQIGIRHHRGRASQAARNWRLASSRLEVLPAGERPKCANQAQVSVCALSTRYIRPTVSPSAATTQKSPGRVSPAITQGRKRAGASGMPHDSAPIGAAGKPLGIGPACRPQRYRCGRVSPALADLMEARSAAVAPTGRTSWRSCELYWCCWRR